MSSTRDWLNRWFYEAAFEKAEKDKIIQSEINDINKNGYVSGDTTTDNVFLLSMDEVKKYFMNDADRLAKTSDYAKEYQKAYLFNNGVVEWWTRTPGGVVGDTDSRQCRVKNDGEISSKINNSKAGIRPAIWVDSSVVE